ncbi:MAG: hypothetical protein [Podoviridae sp. cty5g4]|nr:MAG: hypothetical protein [Podoviridae sp. cty5g4]
MSTIEERNKNDERLLRAVELCSRGDKDAKSYILDIDYAGRIFDDLIDKDYPVSDEQIAKAYFILLAKLWLNPFFIKYHRTLVPLHIASFTAFLDANKWIKDDNPVKKVFACVMQDYLVELYICVAFLVGGYEYMRSVSGEIRKILIEEIRSKDIEVLLREGL